MIISNTVLPEELVSFSAELYVSDIEASLDFYSKLPRFCIIRISEDRSFASVLFWQSLIMLFHVPDASGPDTASVELRFLIDDIDAYYAELRAIDTSIVSPLETKDYGLKQFYLHNPDGVHLRFACLSK